MTQSPRLVALGSLPGGVPVIADVTTLGPVVNVTLTSNYSIAEPDGPFFGVFPRPWAGSALINCPQTISSGTTISLFSCEASALISAGGAVAA